MSHIVGTVQPGAPANVIGPDSGLPADAANTWTHNFEHIPAPTGTKLLILHFTAASLPAGNRLEVDLGYGGPDSMDVFTSADGDDFWTRPVNVAAFADGRVSIRYVADGDASGGATLDKYGRGERHAGHYSTAVSNCDPFLVAYEEPTYDPFWFCRPPPNWEDIACVTAADDIRRIVARSVGMLIHVDSEHGSLVTLSTCSVTLVGPDLVLTAGHCMIDPAEAARSCSVIFNYEVECGGARPPGYAGRFFKVSQVEHYHYNRHDLRDSADYCLFRLAVPPGLPAIQMRHDLPGAGEQVFGIHHPNGAVKKLSVPHPGFATVLHSNAFGVYVSNDYHLSGGSSGGGLFDVAGRVVGVAADGDPCRMRPLRFYPTARIRQQIAEPPAAPAVARDVMIVFDRSGSMSQPGADGRPKIDEARDAASLFVQLVRADAGNRIGLVSFSTDSHPDVSPLDATAANKTLLTGPPPFVEGSLGALRAEGSTTIGGGLHRAVLEWGGRHNAPAILLLTDGFENSPPMIDNRWVQGAIAGIDIHVIGYGTAASLDGPLLAALAGAHNGSYVRAGNGLLLEKYFSAAFGNIFEAGLLGDPESVLGEDRYAAEPMVFNVCGEEAITIVVGWDNRDTMLRIEVVTPGGAKFHAGAPGTDFATGRAWTFLRIPLPFGGECDGAWGVTVFRRGHGDEIPPPAPETRYFVNVVAKGGPRLRRVPDARVYYTGDAINPLVFLSYSKGGTPRSASVRLQVTRPEIGVGTLLSRETLRQQVTVDADTVPGRQATLQAIESRTGQPSVTYAEIEFDLCSDPASTDGAFKPNGLFGKPLADLLTVEGDYSFRAIATYGEGCVSSRELHWSIHVSPGVDALQTGIGVTRTGTREDGMATGFAAITPRDRYGNPVGPGQGPGLTVSGGPGTAVTGPVADKGDGTYVVLVAWDADSGGPGLVVAQPGRSAVVVGPSGPGQPPRRRHICRWCHLLCGLLALLAILFVLLWLR